HAPALALEDAHDHGHRGQRCTRGGQRQLQHLLRLVVGDDRAVGDAVEGVELMGELVQRASGANGHSSDRSLYLALLKINAKGVLFSNGGHPRAPEKRPGNPGPRPGAGPPPPRPPGKRAAPISAAACTTAGFRGEERGSVPSLSRWKE